VTLVDKRERELARVNLRPIPYACFSKFIQACRITEEMAMQVRSQRLTADD
jgi:hypothetical protein